MILIGKAIIGFTLGWTLLTAIDSDDATLVVLSAISIVFLLVG